MAEYNEDAYKLARRAYIEFSCPFERALLSRCVGCQRARKLNLAEREAIACEDPVVREHCINFYNALHDNAQFALKINLPLPTPDRAISHSTDETPGHSTSLSKNDNQVAGYKPASGPVAGYPTKVEEHPEGHKGAKVPPKPVNALWPFGKEIRAQCGGVRGLAVALGEKGDENTDTSETVLQAVKEHGSHEKFPYSEIMRAVVHYEPRKRRK